MLYVYSPRTELEVIGVRCQAGRQGRPSAAASRQRGSADANGGAFGGVASLKGATGRGRGSAQRDGLNDPIVPGMISIEGMPLMKPPYGRITAHRSRQGHHGLADRAWRDAGRTSRTIRLLKGVTIPRTGQSGILGTLTTKTLVICGDCGLFTDETGPQGRAAARL